MLAAESGQRRRRRPEDATGMLAICVIQMIAKFLGDAAGPRAVSMPHQQQRQGGKWWISMITPMPNFFRIESLIVLRRRVFQGVVMRMIGLDQNPSGPVSATGTSGNLRNQLEGPFRRAKIRQCQTGVDGNHADQGHVREVMTF